MNLLDIIKKSCNAEQFSREEGRGHSVPAIRGLFEETEWQTLTGPSRFFANGL